jgi:hypothetical protein
VNVALAFTIEGGSKRVRDVSDTSDDGSLDRPSKAPKASPESKGETNRGPKKGPMEEQQLPPRGAPYFFYLDHSREVDEDPLTAVTPPNSVPAFPIKMHAILSMPELSDAIAWDNHGRSFRILKPKVSWIACCWTCLFCVDPQSL